MANFAFQVTGAFQGDGGTAFQGSSGGAVSSGASSAGVKKRPIRVRRADFTDQKTYEFALRAALLGANVATKVFDDVPIVKKKPKIKVTDTAIEVSAADLAKLQMLAEKSEIEMLRFFVQLIDDEWK